MSFHFEGVDEVAKMLLRAGEEAERIAPEMLQAGAEVLIAAHKAELSRVHNRTGRLANSIGSGDVKNASSGTGKVIHVFPQGHQLHGYPRRGKRGKVRNAQVGFMLEHGTSKFPATHWMSSANIKAEGRVQDAMRKVWEATQNE